MKKENLTRGLSLIEIMVAITIFAILGTLVTSSLILTLQGTKKSESEIRVRENLNYSVTVIERNLRNASKINSCPTDGSVQTLSYYDQYGNLTEFSCLDIGSTNGRLASGSGTKATSITSGAIKVTSCSFICEYPAGPAQPAMVTFDITATDASESGKIGATLSTQTIIYLRN